MKKILFLLLVATMTNIQGIMAQEKIIQTTEADGKAAFQQEMIFPIGEPNTAYAKYFIGNSYLAPISKEQIPFNNVTFEPGCRNNWHIHRATKGGGQMLVCVAGKGWYQEEGKPAVQMLPGDVIHIPANVKHWHGAATDSWFAHLAFEVPGENTSNEWLEPVTDEEYRRLMSIVAPVVLTEGSLGAMAQTKDNMNRIEVCKQNYHTLFGGEALTGQGTDPEMMDILQKFIFGEVFQTGELTLKQREMITCITLATMQTLPQLKAHAGAALNVGVTSEELREVMYLTAPFIGFPKMLNAVATVNEVFKERGISLPLEKQGTVTEETRHKTGKAIQDKQYPRGVSSVMSGMPGDMGKNVEQFLTDYFFGEIYSRGALDLQTRELLGYCVLATLEAESQLHSHYHGNINAGNSPETLTAAVIQCLPYIGFPAAIMALRIIKQEYNK